MREVLAAGDDSGDLIASLETAEREDEETGDDLEDRIVAVARMHGRLPNVSYFAFTATPKPKTMELFGVKRPDGSFAPFSLYSMRQAIEEHFILDVLENYTTYRTYWNLLKTVADDPRYEREQGDLPAQVVRGPARARHRQEGRDHGGALRRPGAWAGSAAGPRR